jgi:hypothetical protein
MKCSYPDCDIFFHPICIRETIHFSNITNLDNNSLLSVCFCEEHSGKFIINNLNNITLNSISKINSI